MTNKQGPGAGDAEAFSRLVTGLNGSHLPESPKNFKSRGGKRSRDKGRRTELGIVRLLQDAGFSAEKISRAGYTGADLSVRLLGIDRTIEVKARGDGFRQLYDWLAGRDILIVKADRAEALVVLPLRLAIEFAQAAEARK